MTETVGQQLLNALAEIEVLQRIVLEQKAEIERLTAENKRLRRWIAPDIFELTDEIERLRMENAALRRAQEPKP